MELAGDSAPLLCGCRLRQAQLVRLNLSRRSDQEQQVRRQPKRVPDIDPLRVERREEPIVHAREGRQGRAGREPSHQIVAGALASAREAQGGEHEQCRRQELHRHERLCPDRGRDPVRWRGHLKRIEPEREARVDDGDHHHDDDGPRDRHGRGDVQRAAGAIETGPAREPGGSGEHRAARDGQVGDTHVEKRIDSLLGRRPRHRREDEVRAGEEAQRERDRQVVAPRRPVVPAEHEESDEQRDQAAGSLDRGVERGALVGEMDEREHHHERGQPAGQVGREHSPGSAGWTAWSLRTTSAPPF